MAKPETAVLVGLSHFLAFFCAVCAYQCGPIHKTYTVRSLEDSVSGSGVRCVLGVNDGISVDYPYIAWYGEGTWGQGTYYRHVGHAFATALGLVGSASDIFGNGESSNLTYEAALFLVMLDDSIIVTGAWNEQWDLVDSADFVPKPFEVRTCGPNFKQYSQDYVTVECVLQNGAPLSTLIGVHQSGAWFHHAARSDKGYFIYGDMWPAAYGYSYGEVAFTPVCEGGFTGQVAANVYSGVIDFDNFSNRFTITYSLIS